MSGDVAVRVDPGTGVREEAAFLPGDEPLLAITHLPPDPPRGAVVVCSAIGWGFTKNYRREVLLARRLAASGLAVQRYHHRGHGESAGRFEGLTFEGLVADACTAASALEQRAGVATTAVVGSRLGALVGLALSGRRGGLDLVAWDPVADGGDYVRDLLRLRGSWRVATIDGERETPEAELARTGVVDVIGHRFSGPSLDDLRALDVAGALADGPPPRRALLAHIGRDVDRVPKGARVLRDHLVGAGTDVDVTGVAGKFEWWLRHGFECEETSEVGRALVERTARWLASAPAGEPGLVLAEPTPGRRGGPSGRDRPVFLPAGDETLFGVLTEAAPARSDVGVVLLSGGDYQLSAGLFGVWAQLAHRLADSGVTSLRLAYRGVAESTGTIEDFDLERPFLDDLDGARRVLADLGLHRSYLVGRCFGARTAAAADPEGIVGLGLVALPVRTESLKASVTSRPEHVKPVSAAAVARRLTPRDLVAVLADGDRRRRAARRLQLTARHALARRRGGRAADDALGWLNTGLVDDLERMTAAGVPVLLVHGTGERGDIAAALGGRLGQLVHDGPVREHVVDTHNVMYTPDPVADVLFDHVVAHLPPVAAPGAPVTSGSTAPR